MKKPALRKNRMKRNSWTETNWTKSSKSVGEYIFRRLSIDQSDKNLSRIRPRHNLSQLIVQSKEIDRYVSDYLALQESKRAKIISKKSINSSRERLNIASSYVPQS
ncbi:MAG: hypothetical protein CMG04_00735 [Candidatus Marinimicrobia bacterium]|nr:hypothetical protein [Candidatus Neomarinimicrobiota bacterium]